ncbi:MAG: signal peptidase II [Gemmobacter sp.]
MRLAAITGLVTFLVDQALKYHVVHVLRLDQRLAIDVIPPFLNLRMAWNQGINFGLFAGHGDAVRWALVALALAISAAVWVWARRERGRPLVQLSAGLLVGGAFGNVVDRVIYGAVADFLNMSCCGIDNPFAFNVADIAIFAGAIGLAVFSGGPKPRDAARRMR